MSSIATPTTGLGELPTELLTIIFAYSDYITLNVNVRAVCRRFRDIIKFAVTPELLEQLFRSPPEDPGSEEIEQPVIEHTPDLPFKGVVHPALSFLCADFSILHKRKLKIEDVGFFLDGPSRPRRSRRLSSTKRFLPLGETSIANGYAVSYGNYRRSSNDTVRFASLAGKDANKLYRKKRLIPETCEVWEIVFWVYMKGNSTGFPIQNPRTRKSDIRRLENYFTFEIPKVNKNK